MKMPILPICPITSGQPTRMARESFDSLCLRHRQKEASYCSMVCNGKKLPKNIEFIDLKKGDCDMTTYTTGKCDVCGKQKSIKRCLDKMTCSSCDFILRAVRNSPELVIGLLRQSPGDEWILSKIDFPDSPPAIDPEMVAGLEQSVADLKDALEDATRRNVELLNRGESLCRERDALLANIAELSAKQAEPLPVEPNNNRDSHLLDLALGLLNGSVIGVDAQTIASLR